MFCLFFPLKFQTHHLCKFNLTSTIGGDNAFKELLAIKQEEDVTFRYSLSLRCHAHGPLAKHLVHMVHFSGNTNWVELIFYYAVIMIYKNFRFVEPELAPVIRTVLLSMRALLWQTPPARQLHRAKRPTPTFTGATLLQHHYLTSTLYITNTFLTSDMSFSTLVNIRFKVPHIYIFLVVGSHK